ncbi:phosphoribosylanthranilate isomerase [Prosthecobacter vanneervenii]|uniref:N-(5'-phosphoribosyl)anthranilate isomerase n=1 Tax=Prosthecobacter vanneervenii TaxID=48466 RepID=A0A7W7Y7I1_9BACT|nr:phosphoribosylanthranilate isomerase [Prosthecobacter vanneervenii]MBB5031019.1 phosphoribosylanthranilate isomerase [Prosthecobacter vanneervenii]
MFPDPSRLNIKVCGITQPEQAGVLFALGADAVGINLWPKSKRHMPLETAVKSLQTVAAKNALVAVLVNPDDALLAATISSGLFQALQLHGDETPAQVGALMERGVNVIKALQVRDAASLAQIGDYPCTAILLDAYNPGTYGGGGHAFPWELAVRAREMFPQKQILLSGGLTPDNVRQAVEQTHPVAVDVASGVESLPGSKDLMMVARFIAEARGE